MTDPLGAGGTDPNAQSGGAGEPGAANGGAPGASGTGAPGSADPAGGAAQGATFSEAEFNQLRERMRAADQRASKAETDLKALRDKDLPEIDRLKSENATNAELIRVQQEKLNEQSIQLAFLTDNSHKWRNAATALKVLDRSKITVDSDGKVNGMKDALAALAKSDAYLLEDTGTGAGTGTGAAAPPPVLGTPPANGGVGGGTQPSKDAMARRLPAMRSRLGG